MSSIFETKELKRRVISCVVCGMMAMFLGTGSLVFMFAASQYLTGGILVIAFVSPIIFWKIIYSCADKNIYKRIDKSKHSITTVCMVESSKLCAPRKKDRNGENIYSTHVITGSRRGDKLTYRIYKSTEQFEEFSYVLVKFIKEQYQDCLIVRKAEFSEYKEQFPL